MLEEKGLVRVKQGQGTTVTSPEEWDLLDPVVLDAAIRNDESLEILDDLIEVRVAGWECPDERDGRPGLLEKPASKRSARPLVHVGPAPPRALAYCSWPTLITTTH